MEKVASYTGIHIFTSEYLQVYSSSPIYLPVHNNKPPETTAVT